MLFAELDKARTAVAHGGACSVLNFGASVVVLHCLCCGIE